VGYKYKSKINGLAVERGKVFRCGNGAQRWRATEDLRGSPI